MKMVLDNPLEKVTKDFNKFEIKTTIEKKDGSDFIEYTEKLGKHSLTVSGYKHQLQLEGYKVVD